MRELTVEQIAALTGDSLRSVQKRVGRWFALQDADRSLPRVRRETPRGELRWRFLIDGDSYDAWCDGAAPLALPVIPRPASDAAHARGCICVSMETPGARGAFVIESCPVHGGWLAESA